MEKDVLRRFQALVDTHGFFNDLQMCPCGFETLGGFDAEALAAELIGRADNGEYDEENCNYRPLKWIEKAIMMSERLIGTREGDVPAEEIGKTVHALYPGYGKKDVGFREARELLRGKIKKMVESSLKAKRHFLVFPENPQRWMEIRPFFEGYVSGDKELSRALWAYSDGFNKIDMAHAENRAAADAIFSSYPDFCHDEARTALRDALRQYNDTLRKMKIAALSGRIMRKFAELEEAQDSYPGGPANDLAKKLYFEARKHEKDALSALEKGYHHPEFKKVMNTGDAPAGETAREPDTRENAQQAEKEEYRGICKAYARKMNALEALESKISELDSEHGAEMREQYFALLREIEKDEPAYERAIEFVESRQRAEDSSPVPVPLVVPFSRANAEALVPVDAEDAPRVEAINWEASYSKAKEAHEYVIRMLAGNSRELATIVKYFSKGHLAGADGGTSYLFGF